MVEINGIPVYQCQIDMDHSDDTGIIRVSLVDSPAVMSDFLAFKNEDKVIKYAIADEEKRLVMGVVMRADFPIYRYDEQSGEYYVIYTAETIRKMAQKYLSESRQNNVDLQHDGVDIEGVEMVQWFIKDSTKGIIPEGFEKISDGSLFAEYKVEDGGVWDQIKDGTFKGFSLEGRFHVVPEDNENYIEKAIEKAGKFSKQNKKMPKMSKFKQTFRQVAKIFGMEFGSVSTDKGLLQYEEDELAVGIAVVLVAEDGTESTPADGEYTSDDKKITIAEGKVTAVEDLEKAEEPEPEPQAEEPEQMEEEESEPVEHADEADLEARIKALEEANAKQDEETNELWRMVDALLKKAGMTRDSIEQMSEEERPEPEEERPEPEEEKKPASKNAHDASKEQEEKPKTREEAYALLVKKNRK